MYTRLLPEERVVISSMKLMGVSTRGTDRRGQIPEMLSIHVRPPEVDDRVMPGHREGDFIKGAGNQSRWACWSSARAAWCCWPRWSMPRPPLRWRAFLPS